MKYLLRFILTLFLTAGGCFNNPLFSQTTQFDSGSNVAWVVPAGVTSIKVETWGAGGRGGSFTTNGTGNRGGGGGGAYASSVINVTSGATYYYTVGTGSSNNNTAGGDSWFSTTNTSAGAIVLAKGGSSALTTASTGAAGGVYSTSIGNVRNNGGRGADGSGTGGGGGGSSAGSTGLGVNATNQFGAVGPTGNDGIGGNGGASGGNNAGAVGIAPGGGGGGAFRNSSGTLAGGNGANGRVIITILGPQSEITNTSAVQEWIAPENVTSIEVETWGGGGRGGTASVVSLSSALGGGGGGGYSRSVLTVTPGTKYYVNVGAGSNNNNAGEDSWFSSTNLTTGSLVRAKGGSSVGINTSTGALGGTSSGGTNPAVGTIRFSGGNGASGNGSNGGAGGSSAGFSSNGISGTNSTAGAPPNGGGKGGDGRTGSVGNGINGSTPGGGGGGSYSILLGAIGGSGANGKVTIHTYYNLSIAKTVTTTTPLVGTNVTFTITIKNEGTNNANGIVVTDVLPTGITYVSNTGTATYNASNRTLTWNVGSLAPAATTSINLVATVNTSGDYINTANMVANIANSGNSSSKITLFPQLPTADLQLNKEVNNAMPLVSGQVVFTLTAYNAGPQNATGVKVNDILPFGFTHVSNSGGFAPSTGVWNIGNLDKGVTQTLTITAMVNPSGNYYNQAVISGNQIDPNETNNTSGIQVYPMYPITEVVLPCATTTYNLNTITIATPPAGSQVSWHTASPASDSNKIATPTSVRAEQVYYVSFYNTAGNCYGATSQVFINRSCLITNPMIRQRTK